MPKRKWLILPVVALVGVQLWRPDRTNQPVNPRADFSAHLETPEPVRVLLSRACLDCHSNQTRWPWYSEVAPFSWIIANDVQRGRRELNLSAWTEYRSDQMTHLLEEAAELVSERGMPPWYYRLAHGDARLSDGEIKTLADWASGQRARLLSGQSTKGPSD